MGKQFFSAVGCAALSVTLIPIACSRTINDKSTHTNDDRTIQSRIHKVKYSYRFLVYSKYPGKIRILEWSNFGMAGPGPGNVIPNAGKGAVFPEFDHYPDETQVTWRDEETGIVNTQTLQLKGVVPPNTPGRTHFDLSADGLWEVRFVPELDGPE